MYAETAASQRDQSWWRNNSILPIKPSSTHLTNLQRGALAEYGHELLGEHVLKRVKKRVLSAELERVEVIPFSTGVGRMSKNAEKALTLYKACCQRISPRRHNCLPFVTCWCVRMLRILESFSKMSNTEGSGNSLSLHRVLASNPLSHSSECPVIACAAWP